MCALGEELWLAPDCRQGRTASLLSQHTKSLLGWASSMAGREKNIPPSLWAGSREEKVLATQTWSLLYYWQSQRRKKSFWAHQPPFPTWRCEKQAEVKWHRLRGWTLMEKPDLNSGSCSCGIHRYSQFHSGSKQCGLNSSFTLKGSFCARFFQKVLCWQSSKVMQIQPNLSPDGSSQKSMDTLYPQQMGSVILNSP